MASYFQFRKLHPENRLLYYVCGAELALTLEVKDAVTQQWTNQDHSLVYLDVEKCSFSTVENAILMQPDKLRVVQLDNVDKLSPKLKLALEYWAWEIAKGNLSQVILICWTREDNPDTKDRFYRPFVEKGRYIECATMSVESMKKFAMQDYRLTEKAADLIVSKVSYNFRSLNNELEKISVLNLPSVEVSHVEQLVEFWPADTLLSSLLKRDKTQAKLVVSTVAKSSISYILNTLTKKLCFLYRMIEADQPGTNAHILASKLEVQPWQLLEYFPYKKFWSKDLITEKLGLLTRLESFHAESDSSILNLLAEWW